MACLHSIKRFSRIEWEVSNREGYICTVNLTEDGLTYFCNLPQLQKFPCADVIAACAKERDCANISTYFVYAPWYTVENTVKLMLDCFLLFLIHGISYSTVGLLSYHLKLKGRRVAHLLFAYTVLWMMGMKAICNTSPHQVWRHYYNVHTQGVHTLTYVC